MKTARKLSLNRETLHALNADQLRDAKGATGIAGSCQICQSISYCYACITVPEASCEICQ